MAMRRPHEVLKVGRYLAAAGQAGLKPATTIRTATASIFVVITMVMRWPHEVMKVGRRLAA